MSPSATLDSNGTDSQIIVKPKQFRDDLETKMAPLDASKIKFTPSPNPRPVPSVDDPIYNSCNLCTDHMVTAVWKRSTGWDAPELKPYGAFTLMPTASVLHYGTECFEGLKAYRGHDGKLRLFRPNCNAERMLVSATRVGLPAFDPKEVEKLIIRLLAVDGEKWIPKSRPGHFIYLRPALIGSHAGLGVAAPAEATLFIIAVCFPQMDSVPGGISLLASERGMVRAWPGGYGYAKVGGNYAGTLSAQAEAAKRGYTQILWLLGEDNKVTEAGASNFMLVWKTREGKKQLITAPLGDKIILDGVTRRSVLELARQRFSRQHEDLEPLEVVEKWFTMDDILAAHAEGRIIEAFAVGTAWFVAPISRINFGGKDITLVTGAYTAQIKDWLRGIMYGGEEHEWGVVIEEEHALL